MVFVTFGTEIMTTRNTSDRRLQRVHTKEAGDVVVNAAHDGVEVLDQTLNLRLFELNDLHLCV